ncbi:hypothetical protein DERF_000543 [Dermatophagoides farinae]|uniref:DUF4219 domain-containing protein n=1 Tax=Dermatophagoides farinae TaxID=6954 RepID=A0A922I929_DERFA|nr:hypothetical protein HUG17_8330 [Dermatophagoides farinae]KAH9526453.1 hypothetical protein DERF_000543 [Dermatophagoides farinae]
MGSVTQELTDITILNDSNFHRWAMEIELTMKGKNLWKYVVNNNINDTEDPRCSSKSTESLLQKFYEISWSEDIEAIFSQVRRINDELKARGVLKTSSELCSKILSILPAKFNDEVKCSVLKLHKDDNRKRHNIRATGIVSQKCS